MIPAQLVACYLPPCIFYGIPDDADTAIRQSYRLLDFAGPSLQIHALYDQD